MNIEIKEYTKNWLKIVLHREKSMVLEYYSSMLL